MDSAVMRHHVMQGVRPAIMIGERAVVVVVVNHAVLSEGGQ